MRRRWLLGVGLLVAVAGTSVGLALTLGRGTTAGTESAAAARQAALGSPPANQTPPHGVTELSILAAHLAMMVHSVPTIEPNGAMGSNRSGFHSVGFQRPFDNHVEQDLVKQNASDFSLAVTAIEYCFQHQNADGSFQVVQIPGASFTLNTDPIVGTIFFYADLGHSLSLMQDSSWFTSSSSLASVRARLDALRPKIALGLDWLTAPSQQKTVQNTGRSDTNRWTYGAEAYLLIGQWLNNAGDISIGEGLLQKAEGNLQADGTILEKGGFDSGYQSVSLDNLLRIWFHLGPDLTSLSPALFTMITKGVGREVQAIQPSGQVSHANNTRTYCGGENFRGKPKQGGGNSVVRVLLYYSGVTTSSQLTSTAQSILNFYATHTHSLCALPT